MELRATAIDGRSSNDLESFCAEVNEHPATWVAAGWTIESHTTTEGTYNNATHWFIWSKS